MSWFKRKDKPRSVDPGEEKTVRTEGLFVRKGQRAFKIAVYTELPLEKKRALEKALAEQVLSKL